MFQQSLEGHGLAENLERTQSVRNLHEELRWIAPRALDHHRSNVGDVLLRYDFWRNDEMPTQNYSLADRLLEMLLSK